MPIEDVDYLRSNSKKETYVFLVDSAERDRNAYPNPSSYVVNFTTPFANVVGLEVVDASIPRTQYNIDIYNNTLCFMIHDNSLIGVPLDPGNFTTVTIPPGDYSIQTLLPKINDALVATVVGHEHYVQAHIYAETVSSPPEITNLLKFVCPYPFVFDMQASTVAESLGFHMYTQKSEMALPILDQRYTIGTTTATIVNQQLYHSVDILDHTVALGRLTTLFEGPRGVIDRVSLTDSQTYVAQSFTVTSRTFLSGIWAALSGIGSIRWEIFRDLVTGGAPGEPVAYAYGAINISESDGTLSQSNRVAPVLLSEGKYWIQFSRTSSAQNATILYNDDINNVENLIMKQDDTSGWTEVKVGDVVGTASIKIQTSDEYHTLIGPGTYNFIGERYIVLRCPEIEENSYRSLAYSKYFLGLSMFRLGLVGLSDNPVNHVSIPKREFHPVGKLARLTLRFETINGELYDFKGVNHTLTLALHYLAPTIPAGAEFKRSIINPNYNGNFLEYMYTQENQEGDSDDQEEDYNRDEIANYRVQEARHMPEAIRRLDREAMFRANIED